MTVVLPWNVQKFVVIWWLVTELLPSKVAIKLELEAKKLLVKQALFHKGFMN